MSSRMNYSYVLDIKKLNQINTPVEMETDKFIRELFDNILNDSDRIREIFLEENEFTDKFHDKISCYSKKDNYKKNRKNHTKR